MRVQTIWTLWALLIVASNVSSEAIADTRLELEGGLVSSNFSINTAAVTDSNKAFTFGAKLDFDWVAILSLEAGLQYVPKGYSTAGFTQSNYYLNLPVLLKARFPVVLVTPFVAVGPEFGYELGNYYSVVAAAALTKKYDFGVHFAGGVEFGLIPALTTYLRLGYSLGLINVADTDAQPTLDIKTRALLITLGVVLSI